MKISGKIRLTAHRKDAPFSLALYSGKHWQADQERRRPGKASGQPKTSTRKKE